MTLPKASCPEGLLPDSQVSVPEAHHVFGLVQGCQHLNSNSSRPHKQQNFKVLHNDEAAAAVPRRVNESIGSQL